MNEQHETLEDELQQLDEITMDGDQVLASRLDRRRRESLLGGDDPISDAFEEVAADPTSAYERELDDDDQLVVIAGDQTFDDLDLVVSRTPVEDELVDPSALDQASGAVPAVTPPVQQGGGMDQPPPAEPATTVPDGQTGQGPERATRPWKMLFFIATGVLLLGGLGAIGLMAILSEKVGNAHVERDQYRAKLEKLIPIGKQLQQDLAAAQQQVATLTGVVATLRSSLAAQPEAEPEPDAGMREGLLLERVSELEAQIEAFSQERTQWTGKAKAIEQRLQQSQAAYRALDLTKAELTRKLARLTRTLTAQQDETQRERSRGSEIQASLDEAESRIRLAQDAAGRSDARIEALKQEVLRLNLHVQDLEGLLAQMDEADSLPRRPAESAAQATVADLVKEAAGAQQVITGPARLRSGTAVYRPTERDEASLSAYRAYLDRVTIDLPRP